MCPSCLVTGSAIFSQASENSQAYHDGDQNVSVEQSPSAFTVVLTEFGDVTTIHDQIRRRVPTVFSPSSYSFGCIFDPSDAAMKRLVALTKTKQPEAIVFTFSDGSEFSFFAYAAASGAPTGSAQEVVKTNVSLESQGLPNVYG